MIQNSPSIITNGLIFSFDSQNNKSYTGPVMSNIATQITARGISDNGSSFRFFNGTDTDYIPSIGNITYTYVDMYNDYNSSGNCCPSPLTYGDSISVSGNTLYTYGILYRSANRYTNANLMYHYEFNSSGGYLTEFGVHGNSGYSWQETDLGNGWYWSRAKFTSQPTAASFNTGSWMYQYATWNRWEVAKILISAGDWTNVHPKYWPSVASNRTTNILYDLTNNNTLTATALTYASDGMFSFNGSSNYIDCGNATVLQQSTAITMSAWVYPTSLSGLGNIMAKNGNSAYRFRLDSVAGALWWYVSGNSIQGGNCPLNTWSHCVVTGDSSGLKAYVNGVLVASNATAFTPSAPASGNLNIGTLGGAEYFQGKIASGFIYNRALSAAEVQQNFQALRGRYGI